MTIASTLTTKQYTSTGVNTQFAFPNKIFSASDLVVTIFDLSGNTYPFVNFANAALGLTFSVQNVDVDTGPTIVLSSSFSNGWTIDIRTQTPELQSTSIKNQGSFLPELHEEAFDRLTREIQDLQRLTYQYGVHGPDTETVVWPTLPNAALRAGGGLVFDNNGLPVIGVLASTVITGSIIANLLNLVTSIAPTADKIRTVAEIAAGVTPINYSYVPGHVYRYGNNTVPGTTDMTAAINAAANVGRVGVLVQVPQSEKLLVSSSLNFSRIHAVGLGNALGVNGGIQASAAQFDIITSTGGMTLENIWVDGAWDGVTSGLSGDSLSLTAISPAHPYINTLINCNFQNNKKRGIYIERGGYTSFFHCVSITSGLHAFECFGLNTDECTSIRDYGGQYGGTPFGYGIKLTECAAMIFNGTIIETTYGIQLNGIDNRTIKFDGIYEEFNPTPAFTAKIDNGAGGVGTTLTVTAPATLAGLGVGSVISGAGVTANTVIVGQTTGIGSTGIYTVNNAQNIASEAMTATPLLFVDNGGGIGLSISGMFGANLRFPFAPGIPSFLNWQDVYFSGNSNLVEGPIPLANRVIQADSGQISTATHGALSVTVTSFSLAPGNWMIDGTLQTADGGAANLQDASFVLTTDVSNNGAASGTSTFEVGTARVNNVPLSPAVRLSATKFYQNLSGATATFYMRSFLNNSAGTLAYRGFMTAVKVS